MSDGYNENGRSVYIKVVCNKDSKAGESAAKVLSSLTSLFEIEASYN